MIQIERWSRERGLTADHDSTAGAGLAGTAGYIYAGSLAVEHIGERG